MKTLNNKFIHTFSVHFEKVYELTNVHFLYPASLAAL